MKRFLVALLLAILVSAGTLTGGFVWLENQLGSLLQTSLPALLTQAPQRLHIGQVNVSLWQRQLTLRDISLDVDDTCRLRLSRLSATVDEDALDTLLPHILAQTPLPEAFLSLVLPHDIPAPQQDAPLLTGLEGTGLIWQTDSMRLKIQRQQIARLSLPATDWQVLLTGATPSRPLSDTLSLQHIRCQFLSMERPSLLQPLQASLQELQAERLHDGMLYAMSGTDANLRLGGLALAGKSIEHTALPLASLQEASSPKAALLAALASPATVDIPSQWRMAGLLEASQLSREAQATPHGQRETLRLIGGRVQVPALAAALGLSLPGQTAWRLEGCSQTQTDSTGQRQLRVTLDSTPATLCYALTLCPAADGMRWRDLDLTLDDRGLLALWALNCPDHDPLPPLLALLAGPLPPRLLQPLQSFIRQPGQLHLISTTSRPHAPLLEPPAHWADDVRFSFRPGPDFLREQIDRLLQMQK